ncbi:hypothetical protein [Nocardiopsis suaedae]|uniref:SH3 domain-containing protein n=1 Tax=Nocardiopsis suaedae TaxID=3018444 RepID=A0ABT4THL6_9ACTN|nr:hypothetical protein [Nocardiopsis suaedae]MDA2804194.1 hypothetical protein [Nocardiopsis suaedae]
MRMLLRAGTAAGAAVLAMAPVSAAQAAGTECETVASALDSTGAGLWIEVCDPYRVRAGGEGLSPGDTVELREAGKGMLLAEAVVPDGEDEAATEYWSGYVGYGDERPYGHVASVDLGGDGSFVVRDYGRSR